MKLTRLTLNHFRNYDHCVFDFNDSLNIIIGNNGSGKTTLLEAIHFLSLTKSFRTYNDSDAVNYNHDYFQILGSFLDHNNNEIVLNLNYSKSDGKKVFLNHLELEKKTDIIGKIPVIVLSPGNQNITDGTPLIRRNFIDRIISQINREYLQSLIEYRRMLNQRNALLIDYRNKNANVYDQYIDTVDDIMIRHAAQIQLYRQNFINDYNPFFKDSYNDLSHFDKTVFLKINSNVTGEGKEFSDIFKNRLINRFERDVYMGRTGAGPHLDQILLIFGDRDIRFIGSQGEHKIYMVALKIAESQYLENQIDDKIIFLLDDLFALLDINHCVNIIRKIGKKKQTFITATDIDIFKKYGFKFDRHNMKIFDLPIGVS